MKRLKNQKISETLARFEAEDRACDFLGNLSAELAAVVAFRVEWFLTVRWEAEQLEMLRRNDPREVYQIAQNEKDALRARLATIEGKTSDLAAEQRLIELFSGLQPDVAWLAAHLVSNHQDFRARSQKGWADRQLRRGESQDLLK